MNLMLYAIFIWIAIGLFSRRLGRREYAAIGLVSVVMTSLYYLGLRFL